jgi:hypothetical protein
LLVDDVEERRKSYNSGKDPAVTWERNDGTGLRNRRIHGKTVRHSSNTYVFLNNHSIIKQVMPNPLKSPDVVNEIGFNISLTIQKVPLHCRSKGESSSCPA